MELLEMTWPQVEALNKNTPVVLPIAALEQHGRHMPLFTDSLLLGEVVRRAKEALHDRVVFAPLMWLGNSDHHLDFPGTLSASARTYLDLLIDMTDNCIRHGFLRIVLLNGHGGNIVPSQQAMFELKQKYRQRPELCLLCATYWALGSKPHQAIPGMTQTEMGHACDWETSMMLRLRPELVRDHGKVREISEGRSFSPASRAWVTRDRSDVGHIGDPSKASAEKGEALFRMFAGDVVKLLERVVAWDGKEWDA